MAPPTVAGSSTAVNVTNTIPPRHAHQPVSWVILGSIKSTINNGHHMLCGLRSFERLVPMLVIFSLLDGLIWLVSLCVSPLLAHLNHSGSRKLAALKKICSAHESICDCTQRLSQALHIGSCKKSPILIGITGQWAHQIWAIADLFFFYDNIFD